jgi:hypothetical protein
MDIFLGSGGIRLGIFSPICYYLLIFGLLQISIGLSVFGFNANKYKRIAIRSLLTIRNIESGIR